MSTVEAFCVAMIPLIFSGAIVGGVLLYYDLFQKKQTCHHYYGYRVSCSRRAAIVIGGYGFCGEHAVEGAESFERDQKRILELKEKDARVRVAAGLLGTDVNATELREIMEQRIDE